MTAQVVTRIFADIHKECYEGGEGAKEVIQAYDAGQEGKGYLAHYKPPGPNGTESLSSAHAEHIAATAAKHADAIGGNFHDRLPEWNEGYGLSDEEKERQDRHEQAAQQQKSDAEVTGYPNLEDLYLRHQGLVSVNPTRCNLLRSKKLRK